MTDSRFSTAIRLLPIFGVVVLAATSWAQQRPPSVEKLANTYGLESFGQIEAIRYTFNAQFPGVNLSRSWTWEPKTNQVTYEGKDKDGKPVKVTYLRTQLSSQPDTLKNEIDPGFINDNYWRLFPFHAYWDNSATVTDQGMQKLPLGNGSAELVAVKYPSEGGYTPGDTWELWVGKDSRVEQMFYHRGGPRKPSAVIATWTGYKKAGPLLISTAPRHSRRQAAAHFLLECCRQAGGFKYLDGRALSGESLSVITTSTAAPAPLRQVAAGGLPLEGNVRGTSRAEIPFGGRLHSRETPGNSRVTPGKQVEEFIYHCGRLK